MKTYEERHQEDLAHGRMIWVRMPDSVYCHHYTMAEFEEARKAFNKKAIEVQKETGADHVLYGYKEYNEDGTIKSAGLDIIPLDDEEFHRRADTVTNYMVYAVHKH